MRIGRKSFLLLVCVKVSEWRWPLVVPIPLSLVQEILRALTAAAWLLGRKDGRTAKKIRQVAERQRWLLQEHVQLPVKSLLEAGARGWSGALAVEQPHCWLAAMEKAIEDLRSVGPFSLVDVDTDEARVVIRLV